MVGYMGTSLFIKRIFACYHILWASQVALVLKNPSANAGDIRDASSIPRSGRSLGGGHGKPFQYSCLENPQRQRSLAGYSPEGRKESDRTKQLTL